jgi:transcriptional regulator
VYIPDKFRETRSEVLQGFLDQYPLATLVAMTQQGLVANHIPLVAELAHPGGGRLRGHIARANTLWREVAGGAAVLAVFTGHDTYVSPNWYPSKREHGKVVPTWNYATVHVAGTIRFTEDADWLRGLVSELTDIHERSSAHPWHVSDAPSEYIDAMLRAIVGLEITVTGIVGKFKGSQNRARPDREGVSAALRQAGRSDAEIAELVPQVDAP